MPNENDPSGQPAVGEAGEGGLSTLDLFIMLASHWRVLLGGTLMAGLVGLAIAFAWPQTFTARTLFLPQQQQQNLAATAMASLGALGSLAGAAAGVRNPADQYVALMQSATVMDRIIDQFDLMRVYDEKYRVDARKELSKSVRVALGKKDGLISVEVDDESPKRAADMANAYVVELKRLTQVLALTEAQQRRVFFEAQLTQTRERLILAQQALQASGFTSGALRAEPRAAAEGYAKLRAEVTSAEVRLQAIRRNLSDSTSEVQQQMAVVSALRAELSRLEVPGDRTSDPGYVSKYREFKYQETLFELFSRQFEMARLDEARDGTLIQVVDTATPPEKKSKPKRALIAIAITVGTFLVLVVWLMLRHVLRMHAKDSGSSFVVSELRAVLSRH
jgi:uncharacterized protein involved in exopolysaccharide biosynthesis